MPPSGLAPRASSLVSLLPDTMDATWFDVFVGACAASAIMLVPGRLVAWVARTPRRLSIIAAPLISATLVATAAFLSPKLGLGWGVGTLIGVTLAACIPAALVGYLTWRRREHTRTVSGRHEWQGAPRFLVAALGLSTLVYVIRLGKAIATPFAVSQTYDAPFHLNLVEYMLDRSDASFLHVAHTIWGTDTGFYPAVWHEIVSLVVLMTGQPIPVAAQAMTFAMTAVLWPLMVAFTLGCLTRSWNISALGALLAFSVAQMPFHFIWFGVLYPNLLSYVLMLPMLTLAAYALLSPRTTPGRWHALLFGLIATPGYAIVHPSGFFTFVLLVFPILVLGLWTLTREHTSGRWSQILPPLSLLLLLAGYWALNRVTLAIDSLGYMRGNIWYWPPLGGWQGGLLRALSLTSGWDWRDLGVIPVLLGLLVIIGCFYALKDRRTAWLPFSHLIVVALNVVAFSVGGEWRPYLIGLWYSDPHRFAAMLGITAVPLLALGTYASAQWLTRVLARFPQRTTTLLSNLQRQTAVACSLLIFLVSQFSGALTVEYGEISKVMAFDNPTRFGVVSQSEYELMNELPSLVPPDTTLIGNPWNGSSYAPALSRLEFAFPHTVGADDSEANFLAQNLNDPSSRAEVCRIVHDRHITHILDFGNDYLWKGDPNGGHLLYPGLDTAYEDGNAEIVRQNGTARLLRITACD